MFYHRVQIILAAKWLVRHSSTSTKQQRRPFAFSSIFILHASVIRIHVFTKLKFIDILITRETDKQEGNHANFDPSYPGTNFSQFGLGQRANMLLFDKQHNLNLFPFQSCSCQKVTYPKMTICNKYCIYFHHLYSFLNVIICTLV